MSEDLAAIVAALLEPLPGDAPTGRDLRYEGDYERLDEARRDENPNEARGVWLRPVKLADWSLVEGLAIEALSTKTKDLRIAGWLSEAWIGRHGFAGVAPGLQLAEGLCRLYWDRLQPHIGSDAGVHISAIEWLNQRVPVLLRQIPVAMHQVFPDENYSWSDYLNAEQLEMVRLQDKAAAQRSENAGAVTLAQFATCRDRTADAMLAAISANLAAALAALEMLDETLNHCCGKDAPGLSRIRNVAGEIAAYADAELAARRARVAPVPALPPPETALPAERVATSVPGFVAAPATREAAYRQLAAIAEMLRAAEPHSPVPYVLDQLVEWGAMPLGELETRLHEGGSNVSFLLSALGLAPAEE